MNIKKNIEKVFKTSIIPYLIWYKLNKNKLNFRMPLQGDNLYFDGFPRSGNTYSIGLLKYIFKLRYTSHLHSIVGFKIANFKKIPIITIIREPKDTISSYLYTKISRNRKPIKKDLINQTNDLLFEYCFYYDYISKNINKTYIINFKSIIFNSELIISDIEKSFNFKRNSNLEISDLIKNFSDELNEKESLKEVAYSSMPNEERTYFKNNVKQIVENNSQFEKAQKLYNLIKKHSLN